jgi:hypothetical protein
VPQIFVDELGDLSHGRPLFKNSFGFRVSGFELLKVSSSRFQVPGFKFQVARTTSLAWS